MLKKTAKDYYVLEKFAQQTGVIHGFSTRKFGNMSVKKSLKENKNLNQFLNPFGKSVNDLIMMEQIHGNQVKVVNEKDRGRVLPGIDGMVCNQPGIVLGVKVADCLPILFYDKEKKIIGIVHAGWKGTLKKIGQQLVSKMKSNGCQPKDIIVGIGPHIGSCCYNVPQARADRFKKEFGDLKDMISCKNGTIHLDLLAPILVQLIKLGVQKENVYLGSDCTACQNSEFFSFRKDTKETFGEILGIIGLRTIPERSWK